MTQTTFQFDRRIAPQDAKRIAGQDAAVLARLRQGPATNWELAQIALKYTSRISSIRKAGIKVARERVQGGTWRYWLEGNNAG